MDNLLIDMAPLLMLLGLLFLLPVLLILVNFIFLGFYLLFRSFKKE